MNEAKEVEQYLELDDSFSPQFVREVNRIKTDIVRIVHFFQGSNFTKDFFSPLSSNLSDSTAILRVQFVNSVSKMEDTEKASLLKELIKLVQFISPDNLAVGAMYERVVDEITQYAHKKGAVSTHLCTEVLVMTSDFRACRVDQAKWRFIKECISKIDYKGIRNVLRFILETQIRRLPTHLSPEQTNELRIVEDTVLLILDRDSVLIPPLISLSEIMRGIPKQAHMFPRLTERIAGLQVNFRPIADLTHVCGRSFIYPIPLHPAFVPNSSFWEDLGVATIQAFVQPQHQLPYRPDHCSGKNMYTLYMILRQPMGKDSFPSENKAKTKSHWDILISIMICEAMAKAEALPEHEPIPRYQWDNIVNIVMYGMTQHLLNPKNFFMVLKDLIKSCKYTRARDEVMWIVFQVVGSLSNVLRLDDAVNDIVDLYHKLFDGDVVWMGASDHPAVFARFLAAASTWILLEKEFPDKIPKPNETIKSHIKFIEDGGENFDKNNTAMLAVLANIHRKDSRIGRQVLPALGQLLEITDEAEPLFELSYRRTAVNSFMAVPVEFLDALTLRSKRHLLSQCLNAFRSFSVDKLPRPSTFETIVRICQSEDFELAVKEIETIAQRSLHVCNNGADLAAKDQCYFLFDFLVYRLPHLPAFFKFNSSISTNILGSFIHHLSNTPQNHQIYRLMEHFLMRRWCWSGFHECINNHSALLGATNKEIPLTRYLLHPKSFTTPVDSMSFPVNPEAFKMSVYHFLRSVHVTGNEVVVGSSAFPHLIAGYGWPKKSTDYFPKWALDIIAAKDFTHLQPNFEEIVRTVDEAVDLQRKLSQNQFIIKYGDGSDIQTIHCMLAVIFKFAFDSLESNLDLTSEFFEVIEKKTPKDMVIMGNYMVDYIIAFSKYQDHNELLFRNIAKAAARVVFEFQVMRADRFLLALTVHPATDEDALLCVQIANEFILTAEFQDRIRWWHNNNVLRKESAPTEYMKALVRYHDMYPEFEACQLVTKNEMKANPHMPTYYGSLIERLMPILDQFLYVALEQQGYKLNPNVLQVVAMFYRYHPMPIHFMYTVLFITHGKMSRSDAKSFVLGFAAHVEDVHLTDAFVKYNHQKATKELVIMELIDRMSASLDFVLVPPSFVAKDWKSAEMGPGAQSLYLACIELMASPHSPEDLVAAMIDVMQMKPHLRPYNVVNLIALLLTALPVTYGEALHAEFLRVFENRETAELTFEELVFDNYEEYQLLNITSRTRSLNVISQAFWTHCNLFLLRPFSTENVPTLLKNVQTEKDLWYTLRLIMPILRRYWENWDTAKVMRMHSATFGPLFIFKCILEKIGQLAESGIEYVYQSHICDLFYNCKYLFAGDFLRETAITEFAKLPESMRERLKCYCSQPETARVQSPENEKEKSPEKEKHEAPPPTQTWNQQPAAPQPPPQPAPQQHQQPPILPQAPPHQMMPHHNVIVKQEPRQFDEEYQAQHRQQQMMQHQQQHGAHHQMEMHHQMPEHQGPPQSVQMHMTPQYPGMAHQSHHHHHQQQQQQQMHQMHQMQQQYGMHHHHPNHPMQQQQMHPMMNNMTPQQYAYMMQMQQMQQQQQQHHNQYMQQQQHHNQQMQ